MENLIIEAYQKAKTKDFFSITTSLEKLLKRNYAAADPRQYVTIQYVRRILNRQGLDYTLTA